MNNIAALARHRLAALPPLALYVHMPWCVRKCPYCDFNSHELRAELPERQYVEALIADLDHALPKVWGRAVYSIFFGGGTPSLFSAASIEALLSAIRARVRLVPEAEITLEANPGTVDVEKFKGYREAGVNRLSLGIQSFDAAHLKQLGRIHSDTEAHTAIEIAQRYFDNINLDLMYGLPGQTLDGALHEIERAIAHAPTHISAYHLTIEPNTLFHRFPPQLPDDDTAANMQLEIEVRLASAGYVNYEISAFSRPGRQCAHNLNYWRFGDYLGIGAGAHGKISFPNRILREARVKHPREYVTLAINAAPVAESHDVSSNDLPFEFMMNALRLVDGVPTSLFEERTGLALTAVLGPLEDAERAGLIERDHMTLRPSARGRRFLNDLLQGFLPEGATPT
jgi:oxygen-independent coproporphyrinogen-3 oxidase